MENKRVLAMYDVRGKQEYIYRSKHIQEIVGASAIIRDVFKDWLYPAARKVRNRENDLGRQEAIRQYGNGEPFVLKDFESRMEGKQYIGEVVYSGGGNFLVLYRDRETCIRVNRIFTAELMKHVGTLKVLCTILDNPDFARYREDNARLYEKHRKNEAMESVIYPVNSLPVSQVDPLTSSPLTTKRRTGHTVSVGGSEGERMSVERAAKYDKYRGERGGEDGERNLNNIVEDGESLLAVIYIDGNGMGAKVQSCLEGKVSYEECVTELRRFSARIQKDYVDDRLKAVNNMLDQKYQGIKRRRTIVSAGDEMAIICKAGDVLQVLRTYFEGLPEEGSSCAGIAIFKRRTPYADAYRLAEECCESGKDFMKEKKLENACLMDFHYCQGGIESSLEKIREKELRGETSSRPWVLDAFSKDRPNQFYFSLELAEEMAQILRKLSRTNVKSLMNVALNSPSGLELELERINAHREVPEDFTLGGKLDSEQKRKLLYDMVLVHGLWFEGEEGM